MGNLKITKDKTTAVIAIIITVGAHAVERLIEIFAEPSRALSFGIAVVMTLLLGVVCLLLFKNKNTFFGLLAALLGYKMLPPTIKMVTDMSLYASELYYLVRCAAMLLFIIIIVKFYRQQKGDEKIEVLPILAIMMSVPFFMQIASHSYRFFMIKTGSMLYYYFASFACYIIASLVILAIAYKSNVASMRFTAYFEFVCLGINILKKVGVIIALAIQGDHISRSNYCWIAIYAVLIFCFWLAKEQKKKRV